jgi:hypothetical protein
MSYLFYKYFEGFLSGLIYLLILYKIYIQSNFKYLIWTHILF